MIKSCKECMEGAPYNYCCKIECGQHEFCRGCKYTPRHKCYHEASSPITDNDDKLLDVLKSGGDLKDIVIDWSKTRHLEPVIDWSKTRHLEPVVDWSKARHLEPVVDWSKARHLEPVVDWSKARPLPPVTDKTDEKDLIPIERVLDDMCSDISGVSSAARDYYRMNYATEEEKIEMDKEDRIVNKFTAIALIIPAVMIITIVFNRLFFN